MELEFTKMHGCGNDYIYINCFKQDINDMKNLAIKLSDRHFGVGADGVICLYPSKIADAYMKMYNADGSEGNMCGNGVRCIAKFLYDSMPLERNKSHISIETKSGVKILTPFYKGSEITSLKVDMGEPVFEPSLIPIDTSLIAGEYKDAVMNFPLNIDGKQYEINCLSMGNPHCVILSNNIDDIDIEKIGPKFENNNLFPDRINAEFVEIIDKNKVKMRVWERGSGETLACGTGACAVCVTLCKLGLHEVNENLTVQLRGGDLSVCYTGQTVFMTGEAVTVYKGKINI